MPASLGGLINMMRWFCVRRPFGAVRSSSWRICSSKLMNPIYHKNLRAVNFVCNATHAHSASLVGDFNQWNPASHPMKQMPDRSWLLNVELKHGHHRYAF